MGYAAGTSTADRIADYDVVRVLPALAHAQLRLPVDWTFFREAIRQLAVVHVADSVRSDMSFRDAWRPWLCTMMMAIAATSIGCKRTTAPTIGVVVDSAVHDFGERRQGEELSHTFQITNQTDVPVKILKAISSCGCAVAGEDGVLPDTTIAPHGTLKIPIRFHTGSSQEVASGRINVSYRLETESADPPPRQFLTLQLRADVIPDYRITPRELDFGEIDGLSTQRATRTLRVTPEAAESVAIRQVRTTSDFLTARVLPKEGDDSNLEIEVSLDVSGLAENRSLNGSLVISTDSKQLPDSVVGVRAKYLAAARIDPTMIVIGSDQEGEVAGELCISSSRPSRILAVSSRNDAIRAEFDARQVSEEHCLRVLVAPCQQETLDDELKIELELLPDGGNRLVRVLTVPVHRFLEKRRLR